MMAVALSLTIVFLTAASPSPVVDRTQDGIERWTPRLLALEPERPMEYFELAEEVADAATDSAQLELARQLFGLAGVLDADRLGRSACLALADLEEDEHARRRLRALAGLLDDAAVGGAEVERRDEGPTTTAVEGLSHAFSFYRRGLGAKAMAALRRPGATDLLHEQDRLIEGGAARFLEDCRLYRTGEQRPLLTDEQITDMLRHEQALLAVEGRAWSSDLLVSEAEPLIEVDPAQLSDHLGADPERPRFVDGEWVR